MRRILRPAFLVILTIFILLVGCSSGAGQPSPQPAFTDPPEDEGSALLLFELRVNQKNSGLKASSDIAIPILIWVDPDLPKDKTHIQGSNVADYSGSMGAGDGSGAVVCTIDFTYLVEYTVTGSYNPGPKCDFDVKVTVEIMKGEVLRSGDCPPVLNKTITDEGIFMWHIPPPPGFYNIPGSLPVVFMRKDDDVKISIQLKNVVVPKSSGCFFGGVDTPIPSDGE